MAMAFIVQPGDVVSRKLAGGKAEALSRLQYAGLPVPAWFVLTPAAFATSLSESQRLALISACQRGDVAAAQEALHDLQPAESVLRELAFALVALCPNGELVAVRSSAIDEDGQQHSFAGQFDSFLDVSSDQLASRIATVWRSGFSARVLAYRGEQNKAQIDVISYAPAVTVQRMVRAEAAGVAFSADPVTGRRGMVVVSAVRGLGEHLVSGAQEGDTYQVDRKGDIIARSLLETSATLSDEQVRAIAVLARRCEQHFGLPQDIEWALEQDALWLLQSRPITSLAKLPDPEGAYARWDNSNIVESYGGITTPLTFSFARHAYETIYRQLCRLMGVSEATISEHDETFRRMVGLVRGRVYYNLLSWYELLALAPGFASNRRFMEQMMGVREGLPEQIVAQLPTLNRRGRLRDRYRFGKTILSLVSQYRRLPRHIRRFYARVERALTLEPGVRDELDPLATMRLDELVAYYRSLERQLLTRWDAPLVNDLFAMMFYGLLRRLAVSWLNDPAGALANDLISGEGNIISAEPAQRVRTLATLAAQSPALVTALCEGSLWDITQAMQNIPAFEMAYHAYLEKFADRCLEELKLESPTLRDDPLSLLRTIGHLACEIPSAQIAVASQSQRRLAAKSGQASSLRQRGERQVRTALKQHPLRRIAFGWILRQARVRVRSRENLRFERTRVFGRVRRIFVELGKRYYALDLLDDPRDIFYLEVDEALGLVAGTATTTDLKGLVAVRRTEFAQYRTQEPPPDCFETRGIPHLGELLPALASSSSQISESAMAGERRTGIGCCPGVVRGPVRLVTDPRQAEVRAGEILVAERTDPGWILLFASAAGVVVERGSLLSHSAIVARELGIPTVVSVQGVTTWLKNGDWIELDGSSGSATKLPTPDEATPGDPVKSVVSESELTHA